MKKEETIYTSFLGTGWSFPPTFKKIYNEEKDKTVYTVEMVSDEKDIEQSLIILLSTSIRERILEPKFGCNLRDVLFEPLDVTKMTEIQSMLEYAVLHYEPRIEVNNILFDEDRTLEGWLMINIDYTIIATNSRYNMVYPFYLHEGE